MALLNVGEQIQVSVGASNTDKKRIVLLDTNLNQLRSYDENGLEDATRTISLPDKVWVAVAYDRYTDKLYCIATTQDNHDSNWFEVDWINSGIKPIAKFNNIGADTNAKEILITNNHVFAIKAYDSQVDDKTENGITTSSRRYSVYNKTTGGVVNNNFRVDRVIAGGILAPTITVNGYIDSEGNYINIAYSAIGDNIGVRKYSLEGTNGQLSNGALITGDDGWTDPSNEGNIGAIFANTNGRYFLRNTNPNDDAYEVWKDNSRIFGLVGDVYVVGALFNDTRTDTEKTGSNTGIVRLKGRNLTSERIIQRWVDDGTNAIDTDNLKVVGAAKLNIVTGRNKFSVNDELMVPSENMFEAVMTGFSDKLFDSKWEFTVRGTRYIGLRARKISPLDWEVLVAAIDANVNIIEGTAVAPPGTPAGVVVSPGAQVFRYETTNITQIQNNTPEGTTEPYKYWEDQAVLISSWPARPDDDDVYRKTIVMRRNAANNIVSNRPWFFVLRGQIAGTKLSTTPEPAITEFRLIANIYERGTNTVLGTKTIKIDVPVDDDNRVIFDLDRLSGFINLAANTATAMDIEVLMEARPTAANGVVSALKMDNLKTSLTSDDSNIIFAQLAGSVKGDKGDTGATGATGPAGQLNVIEWTFGSQNPEFPVNSMIKFVRGALTKYYLVKAAILANQGTDINSSDNGIEGSTIGTLALFFPQSSSGGSSSFTGLSDTPSSYTGQAGKFMKVNSGATAIEFTDAPSGGGSTVTKNRTQLYTGFASSGRPTVSNTSSYSELEIQVENQYSEYNPIEGINVDYSEATTMTVPIALWNGTTSNDTIYIRGVKINKESNTQFGVESDDSDIGVTKIYGISYTVS